ncbi:MAG: hypothetical protein CVU84_14590 [Firmicutes bacterium HGW-Firmicutes-1]|jgi:accessory gene regulator B|nr:MAG: hypothetical protein CVU84_14590 [Firmicutes bacterium HGW-Firmicutes-1]
MISNISSKLAIVMYKNNNKQIADIEVYKYGLELMISSIVNMLVMIGLSLALSCFKEAILYILFFAILRISAGGYHASTHFKCLLLYSLIMFPIIRFIEILKVGLNSHFVLLVCCVSIFCVFRYAPVDSENKPLNKKEYYLFKKSSRNTVLIQSTILILLVLLINDIFIYILSCSAGMFVESITLLPILNRRRS